jgi:hypothetical protein
VHNSDVVRDVSVLAINVTIPKGLRWTDVGRGEESRLLRSASDSFRMGASRRGPTVGPTGGGRGAYVPFPVPGTPEMTASVTRAGSPAATLWLPTAVSAEVIRLL